MSVVTVLLGWLAFNTVNHDDVSHEAMKVHATLALITLSAFGLLTLWSLWRRGPTANPSWPFTVFLLIAFGFLVATGLRGGELVFHHGLAVSSLPKSDADAVQAPEQPASPVGPTTSEKETPPVTRHHHHKPGAKNHTD